MEQTTLTQRLAFTFFASRALYEASSSQASTSQATLSLVELWNSSPQTLDQMLRAVEKSLEGSTVPPELAKLLAIARGFQASFEKELKASTLTARLLSPCPSLGGSLISGLVRVRLSLTSFRQSSPLKGSF